MQSIKKDSQSQILTKTGAASKTPIITGKIRPEFSSHVNSKTLHEGSHAAGYAQYNQTQIQ